MTPPCRPPHAWHPPPQVATTCCPCASARVLARYMSCSPSVWVCLSAYGWSIPMELQSSLAEATSLIPVSRVRAAPKWTPTAGACTASWTPATAMPASPHITSIPSGCNAPAMVRRIYTRSPTMIISSLSVPSFLTCRRGLTKHRWTTRSKPLAWTAKRCCRYCKPCNIACLTISLKSADSRPGLTNTPPTAELGNTRACPPSGSLPASSRSSMPITKPTPPAQAPWPMLRSFATTRYRPATRNPTQNPPAKHGRPPLSSTQPAKSPLNCSSATTSAITIHPHGCTRPSRRFSTSPGADACLWAGHSIPIWPIVRRKCSPTPTAMPHLTTFSSPGIREPAISIRAASRCVLIRSYPLDWSVGQPIAPPHSAAGT